MTMPGTASIGAIINSAVPIGRFFARIMQGELTSTVLKGAPGNTPLLNCRKHLWKQGYDSKTVKQVTIRHR
jgi:hypothetical protein